MNMPESLQTVLRLLTDAGYEAYPVGGCVRDVLLGRVPADWDICTSALPEETKRIFAAYRLIETGMRHGTVTVVADGTPYEVTTFRCDGGYSDGRHPDSVTFTPSLTEDLARRDFTINAMAMDPSGAVIDPFGGQSDLAARLLRCVGEPERRFREDALRLLRALRFAARYELTVEPGTAKALHECRELIANISVERIWTELRGIVTAAGTAAILRGFSDVLFAAVPELAALEGLAQNPNTHRFDAWEHTLLTLSAAPPDPVIRMAALFHDIGKPGSRIVTENGVRFRGHAQKGAELTDAILRRLHCDNQTRTAITELIALHGHIPPKTLIEARHELAGLGEKRVRQLNELRLADAIGHASRRGEERAREVETGMTLTETVLREGGPLSIRELAVSGNDLAAGGLTGRNIGETLQNLLDAVLDEKLPNERTVLLQAAGLRE